ncbi:MAG: 4Fe-4S dicluster domain-containing protein, partial [Gammaproteobacteria bacterium]|nr:4Fe-4S dicluster domain-containing protein [Gammaproteobacteria bacterium]
TATLSVNGKEVDLAGALLREPRFDLVLDLDDPPWLPHETPPLGYYAPRGEPAALERAYRELPELVGGFEKPKFFNYDPDICAHGASGQQGCRRCIDACPTGAIASAGETVEVDPYLCQGAGSCAMACPSGAMTYAYPTVSDALATVRKALRAYTDGGGETPRVAFYDAGGAERLAAVADRVPECVVAFEVEEIGAVGMDIWLAALAYGARQVLLITHEDVPASVSRELDAQREHARAILAGLGYDGERVARVAPEALAAEPPPSGAPPPPATFAAFDEKRTTLRLAIDHLRAHAPAPRATAPLPEGAPYGEVLVDRDACTLCMACVSVCPVKALADGDERPQLLFVEENCVQCGLCQAACPEDAVRLSPRMAYDRELASRMRVLNEEEPFNCVRCGKPFATQSMMARMTERLAGHWMFESEDAMRRLKMCQDCRVRDMYEHEGLIDVHGKPR